MENVDKLVRAYRKIRDKKAELESAHEEAVAKLNEQLQLIEQELLAICKDTGQTGGKTPYGTFTRTIKSRYTTNNWPAMYEVIKRFDSPQLLEQRIHQGNMKQFLEEHPEVMPEGMNIDSRYSITVRKPS